MAGRMEYLWASRKMEPVGFHTKTLSKTFASCGTLGVLPEWAALDRVEVIRKRYELSFWDGLLIATCLEADVDRLFSEDFSSYRRIDSLAVVHPFA